MHRELTNQAKWFTRDDYEYCVTPTMTTSITGDRLYLVEKCSIRTGEIKHSFYVWAGFHETAFQRYCEHFAK